VKRLGGSEETNDLSPISGNFFPYLLSWGGGVGEEASQGTGRGILREASITKNLEEKKVLS